MAFRFNFANEDEEGQPLESSMEDLSLQDKTTPVQPSREFDIQKCELPSVILGDIVQGLGCCRLYKRTLADVKFQLASQDTLSPDQLEENKAVVTMMGLNSNSDLIRGVYEGGFKTWECSLDLVQFLSTLPQEQFKNKRILELGCGSALPSVFILQQESTACVDVQDYNEQVIQYITIPNILLNTVLSVHDPSKSQPERVEEDEESSEEEEEEEKDQIIGENVTSDVEAELVPEDVPEMLRRVGLRSKAFVGDWSGLPQVLKSLDLTYDMVITSETIYSEEALPSLLKVLQHAIKKPDGVCYVAAKTVYFGVGGGILPFRNLLEKSRDAQGDSLKIEKVFETDSAVRREILKVTWN